MKPALRERVSDVAASLWFLPAVEVIAAIVLSSATIWLDASYGDWLRASVPVVFGGTAEGARTLLSVVAGSVISVVAVIFSVTMIALQQAATQYTPRVLRNFMEDRGNKVVLGTYIATFTFALLVLRQVRSEDAGEGAGFMPSLSIFVTIVLAVVDLGLLVYFIHHTSQSLQVAFVVKAIRSELDAALERHFCERQERDEEPATYGEAVDATQARRGPNECVVYAERDGYIRHVDQQALVKMLPPDVELMLVPTRVGDYILKGAVLARLWTTQCAREGQEDLIAAAFVIRQTRRTSDDPLFGMRQLVDIALKALSPGINDPTTAEDAIDALGSVIAFLLDRRTPAARVELEGGGVLVLRTRTFAEYVDECFAQVRRAARPQPHVVAHLIELFEQLGARARGEARVQAIRHQLDELVAAMSTAEATAGDRREIFDKADAAYGALAVFAHRQEQS